MSRFLAGIIFCTISLSGIGQVQISLRDKLTGKGVEGVALFEKSESVKKTLGITNEDGVAAIALDKFPSVLITSHISYAPLEFIVSSSGEFSFPLEPGITHLEDVAVTGQFEPQSVSKSVFKIRTISSETIQAKGATRMQDILNTELNIRFSVDPALGVSTMSMQGLSGQNIKVLIDGIPVLGRQGTSNAVDLNQINMNSIDRIEIIEGPMSTIYGADALAGVINIITKRPEHNRISGSVRIHEENIGNEYSFFKEGIHQETVTVGYKSKSVYTLIDFGHYYSGGWQGDSTGREKQWHPKAQWIGSGTVGLERDRWSVSYRLDYLNEDLYDPAHYSGLEALDRHYITNRFMHQLQGAATLSQKLTFNGALAYTDYSRKTQAIVVNRNTGKEALALSGQDLTKYAGVTIRGTFQYKISDRLSWQPGYDVNLESGSGGRLLEGNNKISDYAVFVSAEIKPLPFLNIRPGLRFVKNSVYQSPPVLPSINTKFILSPKHDLRLSYGRGFRAPSLRELYLYFYDSNHQVEGNPDLEAELSHSVNASWNWQVIKNQSLSYAAIMAGFYNSVDNLIKDAVRPNTTISSYANINQYKTKGLTINNVLNANRIQVTAGLAYTGRYNDFTDSDETLPEFTWSAEINTSVSYTFEKAGLIASTYYKYTGQTPFYQADYSTTPATIYLAETDYYHWADISLQKTFFNKLMVGTGIHNLFNLTSVQSTALSSGAHSANNNSLASGRSFYVTLTLNL